MVYQQYLRARSSDCIGLAVEQPWSADAGNLIDLAQNYRSIAAALDTQDAPGRGSAGADSLSSGTSLFGWLTRH